MSDLFSLTIPPPGTVWTQILALITATFFQEGEKNVILDWIIIVKANPMSSPIFLLKEML